MSAASTITPRLQALEYACVPTIDFSGLSNRQQCVRSHAVHQIGRACQTMGCFKVVNHGISESVMKGALDVAAYFFELPNEEKEKFASQDVSKPFRYGTTLSKDGISKSRDFLKQYAHPLAEWIGLWPLSPPDYREKMGTFAVKVREVALQLLDAILESLGPEQAYLRDKLEEGMQVMSINNYEKCSRMPEPVLALAPHSDYGCITMLLENCEGLQIIDKTVEAWRAVPELPEALHVHIGDCLEVLSNGRYKSLTHRVMLNAQKRLSIASIHEFAMHETVTTAKEFVDEQHPKGYKDSNFSDFLHYISNNDLTKSRSFIDSLRTVN